MSHTAGTSPQTSSQIHQKLNCTTKYKLLTSVIIKGRTNHSALAIKKNSSSQLSLGKSCYVPRPQLTYLTRDDGDFWDSCFGIGIEQLGTVSDDAAILLAGACKQHNRACVVVLSLPVYKKPYYVTPTTSGFCLYNHHIRLLVF